MNLYLLLETQKTYNNSLYDKKQDKQFSYSLIYNGVSIDFGLGGCHACNKPGIYKIKNGRIIIDLDVSLRQWRN